MFIIPIRKDKPVRHASWVVYTLILANFLIFSATSILSSHEEAVRRLGFVPAVHDPATVFTHMFLHADLLHLLGNMFFLWMFGEAVEEALGHALTAVSYIACGLLGILLFSLANAGSRAPCLGASGAISGMVGMYMALFPEARMDLEVFVWRFHVSTIATSAVGAVGAWLGEQALLGIVSSATGWSFGIAFLAHVGGLLAGIGLGFALARSGIARHYRRMVEQRSSKFMTCPSCRKRGPRMPAGGYSCRTCGAKFRVDEGGNVGLVVPSETGPPRWILLGILILIFGWVARVFYDFSKP